MNTMKKKYNYLIGLLFLTSFVACSEEEVQPFSSSAGINFMERTIVDGKVNWGNGYTKLSTNIDFFSDVYGAGKYGEPEEYITLRVKLEGLLNEAPLKVKFKTLPVEGYDLANVIVPEEGIEIKAGEYTTDVVFAYTKPAIFDKEYQAKIVIDYENSDVVAGTKERQAYVLSIQDSFPWDAMSVESREQWDKAFVPVLGEYGPEKVRFLLSALGSTTRLKSASNYTAIDYYPESYGLQRYMPQVKEALATYNTAHPDAKVQEADGTLVTFP